MTPTDITVLVGVSGAPLVDRRAMLVPGSTEVQMYSNQQWVARFTLRSLYGEYLPSVGALVDIYEQGVRIFSGSIDETTGYRIIHGHGACESEQTFLCVDFAARLHQKLTNPPRVWPVGTPRGQIVFELMGQYAAFEFIQFVMFASGGFIHPGGNTEGIFVADHEYLDELIQKLADQDGFVWFVDSDRRLHYQAATIVLAPWDIDATSNNFTELRAVVNRGDYFNEEYRQISYEWQSPDLESYPGNGVTRTWTLTAPAGEVQKITVGGIEVPFGGPGQDMPYTWEYGSRQIIQATTETILTSGQTIYIYYWKLGSNFAIALATTGETSAERSAYEGNSGKYQIRVDDNDEVNGEMALAKAERDITLWANILVSAEVECHGFDGGRGIHAIFPRPGMVVTIVLIYPAIDQDCLIQEVVGTHVPGFGFHYSFKAYNVSRVGNVVDFFRQISGTRGGGRGGGAVSVGPPGPPGPGTVVVYAPNVVGFAVVIYEQWANSTAFGFEGDITVPVGHADYGHLVRIEVVAFKTGSASVTYSLQGFHKDLGSFPIGATTLHYRAMMYEQPTTTADETWYVSFICYNENGVPTADSFVTDPQIVRVQRLESIVAVEVAGALYQDNKDGLHTVVMITPVAYVYPLTFTYWFDFDDGRGWVWQGWLRIFAAGETFRVGDAYVDSEGIKGSGHIWKPTNNDNTSWRIAAHPGAIMKDIDIPSTGTVYDDFTVAAVGDAAVGDITDAHFVIDVSTGLPQVYTLDSVGIMMWHFYKLMWLQPSLAAAPYYWFSFLTVQVGTVLAGTWTPQPGYFGSSSEPGMYEGRKMTDSGAEQGGASAEGTYVEITGGDWGIPNEFAEDGTTVNPYRTYRFRIYSVSRKGSDDAGGPTPVLNNCWPGGANFFDITIPRHPDTLNLGTTNPHTLGPGMEKGVNVIQPKLAAPLTIVGNAITLSGNSIDEAFLKDGSVHAQHLASSAVILGKIAASAVQDVNVIDVGVTKLIHGTRIFTGNVVLSRGIGEPVIALNNGGLGLFGSADGSGAAGLTSKPHVVIDSTGIAVIQSLNANPALHGSSVVTSSAGITLYSVHSSTANPYLAMSSAGIQMKNGQFQTDLASGQMTMQYIAGVAMILNSGGMTVTNGTYQLVVTASYIQLWAVAGNTNYPFIGITSSNIFIGASGNLMTITSSSLTIEYSSGSKMTLSSTSLVLRSGLASNASVVTIATGVSYFGDGTTQTQIAGGDITCRSVTCTGLLSGHSGLKLSGAYYPSSGSVAGFLVMSYGGTDYKIAMFNM